MTKYPMTNSAAAKGTATMIQSIVGNDNGCVFVPPGVVVGGLTGSRKLPVPVVWLVSPG